MEADLIHFESVVDIRRRCSWAQPIGGVVVGPIVVLSLCVSLGVASSYLIRTNMSARRAIILRQ